MTAAQLCLALLFLTVVLLLFAQFNHRTDTARIAGLLAVLTILGADYFFIKATPTGGHWTPEAVAASPRHAPPQRAALGGNSARQSQASERTGAPRSQASLSVDGTGNGDKDDSPEASPQGTAGNAGSAASLALGAMGRSLGQMLKSGMRANPAHDRLSDVKVFKDCPACPEMVRVVAGTQSVGAGTDDPLAQPSERPQRTFKVWPGYAISRTEITLEQLQRAGITPPIDSACPLTARGRPDAAAACITAAEMIRYVDWLNRLTGRRYRLPSADEWEYAARTSGETGEANGALHMSGGLAEMVADCWPASTPATYVLSATTRLATPAGCSHRVIKDGADGEDVRWQRPSARRAFEQQARSPRIGFRVMRPFDLTAKKGL